jgi:hypothetical protein
MTQRSAICDVSPIVSSTFIEVDGSDSSVSQLRSHHEQALHAIAQKMVTWLGGATVAVWDAETDTQIVEHGSAHLRVPYALTASLMATFETYRRVSKRPVLSHELRGFSCAGVGFKFTNVRRAGGLIAMQPKTAASWSPASLALLHDFAAIIEAQCYLFDMVMRLRMEVLDIAARIASAGLDGFAGKLADGAVARLLPRGAVFVFDDNMRYVYADGEALPVWTSLTRERVQGFTLHQTAAKKDLTHLENVYRDALAGKSYKASVSDGGRQFEALALPIRNPRGDVVAGAVLVQDVTRVRQVEGKLASSANALRMGSAREASATMDDASTVLPSSGTASAAASTI